MNLAKYLTDPNFYIEEYQIGEGNFSIVFLVHPKNNKEIKYALKKIPVNLDDKDSQKFFIRELLIMSQLHHKCIIKFVGFSLPTKIDQTYRIYSEYLPNKTLIEVLTNEDNNIKILTPTNKSIIIYGIASAMSYLHKNKIIHRDLKPENVFLNSEYEPILSDFGLSKICTDELKMTSKLGTPYYMAPELFYDEDEKNPITSKIDVYSYGVTLLNFFTTKYKFIRNQPRTINQLVNYITSGNRYLIPDDTPEFYKKLIKRCWAQNASDRPTFDEIVQLFEINNEFILENSDTDKVMEYVRKVKNVDQSDDMKKSNNHFSFSSSSDEENDENETIKNTDEFDFSLD